MKTVTVKFVVKNQDEADALMNEISDLGNNGYPFFDSSIEKSTEKEIKAHKELVD